MFHTDAVSISPSQMVSVCSGDQLTLELTCTVTGRFVQWSFFLIPEGETAARRYTRSLGPNSLPSTLEVNTVIFTFLVSSAGSGLSLTSRLLISPVRNSLHRTEVNCTDIETSETKSTLINIINGDLGFGIICHK